MPATIVDASTLINLSSIDCLYLLKKFHSEVLVPPEVWNEVVEYGKDRSGVRRVQEARNEGWLSISNPGNEVLVTALKENLDSGEAEAIALAHKKDAGWIFLDEHDAREVASAYNFRVTGVIGILIKSKQEGEINSLREYLDRLRNDAGFWISDELYKKALIAVDEDEGEDR